MRPPWLLCISRLNTISTHCGRIAFSEERCVESLDQAVEVARAQGNDVLCARCVLWAMEALSTPPLGDVSI